MGLGVECFGIFPLDPFLFKDEHEQGGNMDNVDRILQESSEICWMLFGVDYHSLEINQWPRIASYYVAKKMLAGEANIFQSLQEVANAVHKYNRNLITSQQAHHNNSEAAQQIAARGILHLEGRDKFERVTGQRAPEGFEYEARPTREEDQSLE